MRRREGRWRCSTKGREWGYQRFMDSAQLNASDQHMAYEAIQSIKKCKCSVVCGAPLGIPRSLLVRLESLDTFKLVFVVVFAVSNAAEAILAVQIYVSNTYTRTVASTPLTWSPRRRGVGLVKLKEA
ncbi:hypothetical protein J3R82DRAFT_11497 [Butyriboletus roseoflavus]|nr:hypothetical protein J3R82DRAFT_11497 [Butyriboletus roseoflavus]